MREPTEAGAVPGQILADTGKASVLCVDDELINLMALKSALQGFCEVMIASSAEEAETILAKNVPDIALLDIGLPGATGYSLCRRIRGDAALASTRVVMISAHNQIKDRLRAYEAGADDYVIKPFSADEVAAKVRVFYRLVSAERHLQGNKKTLEHLLSESVQELKKKFTTDEETGLPNAVRFALDIRRAPVSKSVILLNINMFAKLNEIYGYQDANTILRTIATRLQQIAVELGYGLYRMRGADFAYIIAGNNPGPAEVTCVVAEIQHRFAAAPVSFSGFEVPINFNFGIALNETHDHLKKAALALEYSRQAGKGQHAIYSQFIEVKDRYEENKLWGRIVQEALRSSRVVPYFQGISCNRSGRIEKYECLVRIRSDSHVFMPHQFLPAASRLGLITGVTREIIYRSFQYFKSMSQCVPFSINIVEEDLLDDKFLPFLEQQLIESAIAPGRVIFEIVESASIAGNRAVKNLEGIKKLGCQLALDDFGTENSNFARILHLKVDFIKIDGRFIRDINSSKESLIVAKTITEFAHSIGAQAVAEFVHSPEVLECVKAIGVDFSQGFLIHKPAPDIVDS